MSSEKSLSPYAGLAKKIRPFGSASEDARESRPIDAPVAVDKSARTTYASENTASGWNETHAPQAIYFGLQAGIVATVAYGAAVRYFELTSVFRDILLGFAEVSAVLGAVAFGAAFLGALSLEGRPTRRCPRGKLG